MERHTSLQRTLASSKQTKLKEHIIQYSRENKVPVSALNNIINGLEYVQYTNFIANDPKGNLKLAGAKFKEPRKVSIHKTPSEIYEILKRVYESNKNTNTGIAEDVGETVQNIRMLMLGNCYTQFTGFEKRENWDIAIKMFKSSVSNFGLNNILPDETVTAYNIKCMKSMEDTVTTEVVNRIAEKVDNVLETNPLLQKNYDLLKQGMYSLLDEIRTVRLFHDDIEKNILNILRQI
jgi:hypothetical protein